MMSLLRHQWPHNISTTVLVGYIYVKKHSTLVWVSQQDKDFEYCKLIKLLGYNTIPFVKSQVVCEE